MAGCDPRRGATTAPRVGDVFAGFARDPAGRLLRRWNWKAALLSSWSRALLFLVVNVSAGHEAAVRAALAEFAYRGVTAGFYGAITQGFRHAEPRVLASVTAGVLLPVLSHGVELVVHWFNGTANLRASLLASACFTVLSTLFNLFAMRHGALIVGEGRAALSADLRRMPRLARDFCVAGVRGGRTLWRRLGRAPGRMAGDRAA